MMCVAYEGWAGVVFIDSYRFFEIARAWCSVLIRITPECVCICKCGCFVRGKDS